MSTTAQVETVSTAADKAKLAAAGLLVVGAVAAFYLLGQQDLWLRIVALLVLVIAVAVAGGLGWLPLGALGVDHPGTGDAASARTMIESVGVDHGTRTGVQ